MYVVQTGLALISSQEFVGEFESTSYGSINTETDKNDEIAMTTWTNIQENGTISTQMKNFGSACFNSHLSPFQIIFIKAIIISKKANIT